MRNASSYQGENERQNKVNRNTNISSIKRVTRKLKEVLCFKGDQLHGTIRNDDFYRNTTLQHCCGIVLNGYNNVPKLLRCVTLKIVVVNRPV